MCIRDRGSGWLLGMLRPWLLYVWMLVSPVCLALPLPESLGLWNGRLFAQYPLTLGTLDPVSYTHLDVYKRQGNGGLFPTQGEMKFSMINSQSCAILFPGDC